MAKIKRVDRRLAYGAPSVLLFGVFAAVPTASSCHDEGQRSLVSVSDAIRLARVSDHISGGDFAHFSPDGRAVVVVMSRGNLENNANEYSLLAWNTADLSTPTRPGELLRLASSSNRPAIEDIRWQADNETLTFLGENVGETHQLYSFNVHTRMLTKLTAHPTNVTSYDINASGDKIVFAAEAPLESIWTEATRRSGVVVSQQFVLDLAVGRRADKQWTQEGELFYQEAGTARLLPVRGVVTSQSHPFLSPDGTRVVVATTLLNDDVPSGWRTYDNYWLRLSVRAESQHIPSALSSFLQYQLVDVTSRTARPLLDAPKSSAGRERVVWLPDSGSVVVSTVLLPQGSKSQSQAFTVEVNIESGRVVKLGDDHLLAVRWDAASNQLVCESVEYPADRYRQDVRSHPTFSPGPFLRKDGKNWIHVHVGDFGSALPQLTVREGMNEPPKIIAKPLNGETFLLDLNPQLGNLRLGRVEEIRWTWSGGRVATGGLYFPPDYVEGRTYPLVIQTHAWASDHFWLDGPWTTGYAAQPLAAKGIVVLQLMDEYLPLQYGNTGQREEVRNALRIYEGAVAYLKHRGIVDPRRVGIVGFSHTCFYVKYALAHSKVKFSAASLAEGEDGGYVQYMTNGNFFVDAISLYGGPPFGGNLKAWMQLSPGFNIDTVETPLRITTLSPPRLLLDWEWYAGMRYLHKPVEMILLEDGEHTLKKPSERFVSQQGNVDWFAFWLEGQERKAPILEAGETAESLAEQYRRWEKLCDLQAAQNPHQPAFCVRSRTH